jgi:hypothetical protein
VYKYHLFSSAGRIFSSFSWDENGTRVNGIFFFFFFSAAMLWLILKSFYWNFGVL